MAYADGAFVHELQHDGAFDAGAGDEVDDLPCFAGFVDDVITPPQQMWDSADLHHGYFAMRLPDRGRETGDLLANNWQDAPGVLVAGASNGGKSVVINNLVYSALSSHTSSRTGFSRRTSSGRP